MRFILIFLMIIFFVYNCDNPTNNNLFVKVVNLDVPQKKSNYKWVIYKGWNNDIRTPILPVIDPQKDNVKKYYKIAYDSKNNIVKVNKIKKNKNVLSHEFEYNDRGNLVKRKSVRKHKERITYFDVFGKETERITYAKNPKGSQITEKIQYNEKAQPIKITSFDDENKIESYSTMTYYKDSNIMEKKQTYTRDSKLKGIKEYENLYLNYIDYFRKKDGKIIKKEWFKMDDAPNELFFYHIFSYDGNGNITKERYDTNNKIERREVENAKGKVISAQDFWK
ncbi:MAG: hypothetical protein OEV44_06885 [Spirochaetota bacterium]|nr:hypothetical protein [Spirochaetota bacterium]